MLYTLKENPALYEDLRKLMNLSLKNDFIDENLFKEIILKKLEELKDFRNLINNEAMLN